MKANRKNLIFSVVFLVMSLFCAAFAMVLSESEFLFWILIIAAVSYLISGLYFFAVYRKVKKIIGK